jgi:ribonucleoside-diphosphate reductase beta chain
MEEYITSQEGSRMNLYPIKHLDLWDMYQKAKSAYWVPEEISLAQDVTQFSELDSQEKHFILMVLGFFATSDFIVNSNLEEDYAEKVTVPELKMFLHFQEAMEDIHSTSYQLLLEALVNDAELKSKLLHSTTEIPCIKAKGDWANSWIQTGTFVERLIAFCIVEGIFFSGSFCSIFWLKKRGLLPGLCQSNELISRDEGMHRDCAVLVYTKYIKNKLPEERVIQMIKSAVEIEKKFIQESLPYALEGMNSNLMCQYIEYVGDHLSNELIGKRIYFSEQPFIWMNLISMDVKTNFFENRVSNYSKTSSITDSTQREIAFDADF